MELTGDTDVHAWARRFADDMMDWKPSREYRHYLGTYTMGIGDPRQLFERNTAILAAVARFCRFEAIVKRRRAVFRCTPVDGIRNPPLVLRVGVRQVRAISDQLGPAARRHRRAPVRGAGRGRVRRRGALEEPAARPPLLGADARRRRARGRDDRHGSARRMRLGPSRRSWRRCRWCSAARSATHCSSAAAGNTRSAMLDLQSEEILYSNNELEKKFRDLETKIEQLSLLSELAAGVKRDARRSRRSTSRRSRRAWSTRWAIRAPISPWWTARGASSADTAWRAVLNPSRASGRWCSPSTAGPAPGRRALSRPGFPSSWTTLTHMANGAEIVWAPLSGPTLP